jgi:hypothetical protein
VLYFLKFELFFEILNYYPRRMGSQFAADTPLIPGTSLVYSPGVTVNRGWPSRGGPGQRIGGLFADSISTISGAHGQIRWGYSAASLKFVTPGACNMDSPVISLLAISKSLVVIALVDLVEFE